MEDVTKQFKSKSFIMLLEKGIGQELDNRSFIFEASNVLVS